MTCTRALRPTMLAGAGFAALAVMAVILAALLATLGDETGAAAGRMLAAGTAVASLLCQILLVNLLALGITAVKIDTET